MVQLEPRNLRIVSLFAMAAPEHFPTFSWEGEVLLPRTNDDEIANTVYRLFNRVSRADEQRLESWGYRLPSMSVGDVIAVDCGPDKHPLMFRVKNFGFQFITPGLDRD